MNIDSAFPSAYLKASDLQGRKIEVVMADIKTEKLGDDLKAVLYFKGKEKGLVLNRTNANAICDVYGKETDAWFGQPIVLYEAMVEFQGRRVPAIRVEVPRQPRPQAAAPVDRVPNGTGNGHVQIPNTTQAPVVGGPGAGWGYHGEADGDVPFSPEMRG